MIKSWGGKGKIPNERDNDRDAKLCYAKIADIERKKWHMVGLLVESAIGSDFTTEEQRKQQTEQDFLKILVFIATSPGVVGTLRS